MPLLEIYTNLKKEQIPNALLKKVSEKCAEVSLKPESLCIAHIIPDQLMSYGGSTEPCAKVVIRCIGNIKEPKHAPVVAQKITEFVSKELNIPDNRFYVIYDDLAEDDVAYTGVVFTELKKKLGL